MNLLQKDDGQYAKTWFRAGKTVASASTVNSSNLVGQIAATISGRTCSLTNKTTQKTYSISGGYGTQSLNDVPGTLHVLGSGYGEGHSSASNKGVRLYYFRFNGADGNKVDLIPVSVNGTGALFDRVSGIILYNGGTGYF